MRLLYGQWMQSYIGVDPLAASAESHSPLASAGGPITKRINFSLLIDPFVTLSFLFFSSFFCRQIAASLNRADQAVTSGFWGQVLDLPLLEASDLLFACSSVALCRLLLAPFDRMQLLSQTASVATPGIRPLARTPTARLVYSGAGAGVAGVLDLYRGSALLLLRRMPAALFTVAVVRKMERMRLASEHSSSINDDDDSSWLDHTTSR